MEKKTTKSAQEAKKLAREIASRLQGGEVLALVGELGAGMMPKEQKRAYISKASVKSYALKVFLRIVKDFKLLDNKKYLHLQKHIQDTGRMLGGWQRSLQ